MAAVADIGVAAVADIGVAIRMDGMMIILGKIVGVMMMMVTGGDGTDDDGDAYEKVIAYLISIRYVPAFITCGRVDFYFPRPSWF